MCGNCFNLFCFGVHFRFNYVHFWIFIFRLVRQLAYVLSLSHSLFYSFKKFVFKVKNPLWSLELHPSPLPIPTLAHPQTSLGADCDTMFFFKNLQSYECARALWFFDNRITIIRSNFSIQTFPRKKNVLSAWKETSLKLVQNFLSQVFPKDFKWKRSDRVGNEVEFIFKFNYSSGKCSVILHDLPSVVHWIFYVL